MRSNLPLKEKSMLLMIHSLVEYYFTLTHTRPEALSDLVPVYILYYWSKYFSNK